jgi:NitT/TauT family transport system substrate-binding protein
MGRTRRRFLRSIALTGALVLGVLAVARADAQAADKVRVGKAVAFAWTFIPMEVGLEAGTWAKYGIDPEIISFDGEAKMQQGLAAGSLDFGLGSGASMAFTVKGAPVLAVAAFAGTPLNIGITVAYDSKFRDVKDLKGKRIAVTTAGSLTEWLARRMAQTEGWGTDGVQTISLGGLESMTAALKTDQVDGLVLATEAGLTLEEKKQARNLFSLARYAPDFHAHVIYARKDLIAGNPDVVGRFVKGYFATIAYMKANRDATMAISERLLHQSKEVAAKTYDEEIPMLLDDGHFDPKAVAVLKDSFVEMGILDKKPTDDQIFTTQFVPAKF